MVANAAKQPLKTEPKLSAAQRPDSSSFARGQQRPAGSNPRSQVVVK
jgi:hypothetical protein